MRAKSVEISNGHCAKTCESVELQADAGQAHTKVCQFIKGSVTVQVSRQVPGQIWLEEAV